MKLRIIRWKHNATLKQLKQAEQLLIKAGLRYVTYPKIYAGDCWVTVVKRSKKVI